MFGGTLLSSVLIAAAAVAGFAFGALLSRLLGSVGNRPIGKGADDLHHRVRALEADLRVAQRTTDLAKTEREALTAERSHTTVELAALREKTARQEEQMRKLRTEIQHECAKTAGLRHELADRAEEMVRTHVQLRDIKTELDVTQVGSDVVIDQITSLERERDDLNVIVEALRLEMAARPRPASPGSGANLLVDC